MGDSIGRARALIVIARPIESPILTEPSQWSKDLEKIIFFCNLSQYFFLAIQELEQNSIYWSGFRQNSNH